jgi:AAA domain
MTVPRPAFERRVLSALEAESPRIPVLVGNCGAGRTFLLRRLRERLGDGGCQYIDVERSATTPERLLRTVVKASPFTAADVSVDSQSPRQAFDALLAFFQGARSRSGAPVTFLLDEALEFRTFENFPGLRHVLRDLLAGLTSSTNRFVLTTRYITRALRFFRDHAPAVEIVHLTALTVEELREVLGPARATDDEVVRAVHALSDGHTGYAQALAHAMEELRADPISALAALLGADGQLTREISYSYELRLHRARGYGALKAILDILAEQEPLTLTEIALRLQRTPGSTKDYLSWLEDVDLVMARQKRYTITDPLLRLWVRLHCRPEPPAEDVVAHEVQQYALGRLPRAAEPMLVGARADGDRKAWGIIEID